MPSAPDSGVGRPSGMNSADAHVGAVDAAINGAASVAPGLYTLSESLWRRHPRRLALHVPHPRSTPQPPPTIPPTEMWNLSDIAAVAIDFGRTTHG